VLTGAITAWAKVLPQHQLDLRQLTDVSFCNLQQYLSCNRYWRLAACTKPYTRTHDPGSRGSKVPVASHRVAMGVASGALVTGTFSRQISSQTRTETLDSGAAENRRIERDLHDGAQARLVAMGMTLDAAGQLIDDDPKAARALLIEARDNSAKALRELRELVRGIHPPILADRGLAEAIRALALDTPLRIHLSSDLDQVSRPSAPIESAAYFAVNELVANVSKHAKASQAWIDIRHHDEMLTITVTDDGQGGADPRRGTGLQGIERRLAAFDGVLAVSSPPGGPTSVTMEILCASR
jgi:signal transduction histidine kinase